MIMNEVSIWMDKNGDMYYSASMFIFHKVYAALFMDLMRHVIMNGT